MTWKIMQGDVRDKLAELPEKSVQCVVTSPPYWGLRDYGLPPSVWGGDPDCEHEWGQEITERKRGSLHGANAQAGNTLSGVSGTELKQGQFCQKCGAWFGCLGLEPTPELYVKHMVEIFRGVWRVLRPDGTLWLNLGDSYNGSGGAGGDYNKGGLKEGQPKYPGRKINTLKPKDLVGIPWRVAFALQADGWWLRSDIIWAKPNPMPESVTDRPTKAHEYIFLLTKKQKYFYDAEAIKEKQSGEIKTRRFSSDGGAKARAMGKHIHISGGNNEGTGAKWTDTGFRNKRTVWTVSTQPYPEAHFATFPPKLIEPCILAGTSPRACEICGAPWERVVEKKRINRQTGKEVLGDWGDGGDPANQHKGGFNSIRPETHTKTLGWQPTCTCKNSGKGRCIVLDPFAGSGTTLYVAEQHGRDSIGIELSEEYCKLIRKRMDKIQMNIFSLGVSE